MKKQTNKQTKTCLKIGTNVFIRTVTNYFTGHIIAFNKEEIIIDQAAWIPETERWFTSLSTGVLREVEPYPDGLVHICRGAIIDYSEWKHELPKVQK